MNPVHEFSFFVPGLPAPGGSKTFFPMWDRIGRLVTTMRNNRPWPVIRVVDDAGERNKKWRDTVSKYALVHVGRTWKLWEGPFKCEFIFFMPRPQAHYRSGRFSDQLRTDAPVFHLQKPDALKLARSTEDALTGIIWKDDSQVIRGAQEKRWCNGDEKPGCSVRLILYPSRA